MNLLEKRLRMLGILGIGGIFDWNDLFDVFPGDIYVKSLFEMSIGEQKIYIFTDNYYLALFYWIEKNKEKSYLDQAYDIITLLSNQTEKIPLAKFKDKPISFDMKRLAI